MERVNCSSSSHRWVWVWQCRISHSFLTKPTTMQELSSMFSDPFLLYNQCPPNLKLSIKWILFVHHSNVTIPLRVSSVMFFQSCDIQDSMLSHGCKSQDQDLCRKSGAEYGLRLPGQGLHRRVPVRFGYVHSMANHRHTCYFCL